MGSRASAQRSRGPECIGVERILSDVREVAAMNELGHIDSETLILEGHTIPRRRGRLPTESCEPMWLPELVSIRAAESQAPIPPRAR